MASMVQNFAAHDQQREQYNNLEGYSGSNYSHLLFNSAPAPASTFNILPSNASHKLNIGVADSINLWQPSHSFIKGCPPLEGPFTPSAPLCTSSLDIDHSSTYITPDFLSFSNLPASFDIEFPLSEENQLLELMGLQHKLSLYSYGRAAGDDQHHDDHDLSQDSIAAAAAADNDEKESFLHACSYGDDIEVKLSNLAGSFSTTFPQGAAAAAGRRSAGRSESGCAAGASRSPLKVSGDNAEVKNVVQHFNQKRLYRENSSAATTSCSNGDENELRKGKDTGVKIEVSEVSQCMLSNCEQQGCIEQIGTTLSPRGYKQNKKRTANMSNSNTSVKAARLETPPDVVHVRARRGQATDSHSLAERVRREKISQRMKVLQEIVPGCHKVLGKAMMLDEIINYVKSLQKQVEFLSMKLAAANQVEMTSMIANEVKFLLPNVEFFEEFSSSCQAMKSEPLMNSLIH